MLLEMEDYIIKMDQKEGPIKTIMDQKNGPIKTVCLEKAPLSGPIKP